MAFVLNRPGPGSFSISWEGKRYVLIAGEAPPPGTPPQIIAKARAVGLVMAESGKPAPPLQETLTVGGIKVKPSSPPGAPAEAAKKEAEKPAAGVVEDAVPDAEEDSPLVLKGAKPPDREAPAGSGGEEQVAQKTKRPRRKKRAAGDKA
jgi:hypothetical protein